MNSPGTAYSKEIWHARLKHWWDENPAAAGPIPRGWILRHDSEIIGFLGCVPVIYSYQKVEVPTVAASSWRVLEQHRSQSLRLFMPLYKLSQEMPVLNTSPNPAVMQILQRSGFDSRSLALRHFFIMCPYLGPLAAMLAGKGRGFPRLSVGMRIITDVSTAIGVLCSVIDERRLEKQIDLNYLRWQLSTPMSELQFVGCIDEDGILTSYLVLEKTWVKGLQAWLAVDWFTARANNHEILALIGAISQQPAIIPGGSAFRILALVSLDKEDFWSSVPSIYCRSTPALHYFSLPKSLGAEDKRCVLAEGDCFL